ncbi:phosphatase PAP2 family protein [Paraburkholderia jirisanensis]
MPDFPLHYWYLTSSIGGASVTLPLTLAIALWLALGYSTRLAFGWVALVAAAASIVTLTKLAFLGWGIGVRALDFTGLSGHAMMSTAVYPVACFLVLLPARAKARIAGLAVGFCIGIAISFSRVVVEAHSPSEAIAGCLMGAVVALLFVCIAWQATPRRSALSALPVSMSLVVLVAAFHNVHVPTHLWVENIALKVSGHVRPFVRARWKASHERRSSVLHTPVTRTPDVFAAPQIPGA